MTGRTVRAVMIFVDKPAEVAAWYAQWLDWDSVEVEPGGAALLDNGDVEGGLPPR